MREDQSLRFCHCIDSLALFANKKLKMFDEMFEPNSKFLIQNNRHEVLDKVFHEHIEIIDEYVETNEEDLLESYLHEIKNWKNAICDFFFVAEVNEEFAIMSCGDISFKVVGITQKINEVCPKAPVWVDAILLPFEGIITYAMSMTLLNLNYGQGAIKMLNEEVDKALSGKIIEFGDDFIEIAPKVNQNIKERNNKALNQGLPFDENQLGKMKTSYVNPSKGTHESPLKGLKGEDRDKEIDKHLSNNVNTSIKEIMDSHYLEIAENFAVKHKPITKYADFIRTCKDVDESWQQFKVSELIDVLELNFGIKDEFAYDLIEVLKENNWTYTIDLKSDTYCLLDIDLLIPYGNLFYYDKKYTWVVFEEFRDKIKSVDWEVINTLHEINYTVIDTCNKLVEMCGILKTSDVFKQFKAWYPEFDVFENVERFSSRLEFLGDMCVKQCDFLITNSDDKNKSQVIIAKELVEDYCLYDDNIDEESEEFRQRSEKFDNELIRIAQHQCLYKFTIFPDELRDQEAIDYYLNIPEIQEFRDFFDERVPDDMDAFQYSEVLTEHLIYSQRKNEVGASNLGDFIDDNGLEFNDEEMVEFLNRFTNATNALPRWDNYGHSPLELINDESLKNSEDEYRENLRKWGMDIAPSTPQKKVGRNELCPCGSGLKYKKCCGRPS